MGLSEHSPLSKALIFVAVAKVCVLLAVIAFLILMKAQDRCVDPADADVPALACKPVAGAERNIR